MQYYVLQNLKIKKHPAAQFLYYGAIPAVYTDVYQYHQLEFYRLEARKILVTGLL